MADDICKETMRRLTENLEDVVTKFKYKLPFDWYFRYCHAVENHNKLRHTFSSIKYTWVTDWWECRVFAFILAISEVYTILILRYFVNRNAYANGVSSKVGVAAY